MKLDLLSILKMVEEEDKRLKEDKLPTIQKNKETALDLQGLFSLFEEEETRLKNKTNSLNELEGDVPKKPDIKDLKSDYKELQIPFRLPRIQFSDRIASDTTDKRELEVILDAILGKGERTIFGSLQKIKDICQELQNVELANEMPIEKLVSSLIMMESLFLLYNSFDSRATGFLNESFSAALYRGQALDTGKANTAGIIADTFDGEVPVSVKTLVGKPKELGSRINLVNTLNIYGKVYFDFFWKNKKEEGIGSITFVRVEVNKENINEFDNFRYKLKDGILGSARIIDKQEKLEEAVIKEEEETYTIKNHDRQALLSLWVYDKIKEGEKIGKWEYKDLNDFRKQVEIWKTQGGKENYPLDLAKDAYTKTFSPVTGGKDAAKDVESFMKTFLTIVESERELERVAEFVKELSGKKLMNFGNYEGIYQELANKYAEGEYELEPSAQQFTQYGKMPRNAGGIVPVNLKVFAQKYKVQEPIEIEFSRTNVEKAFANAQKKVEDATKKVFTYLQSYSDSISRYFMENENKSANAGNALKASGDLFGATVEATSKDSPKEKTTS